VEGTGSTAQIHAINAFDRRAIHVALEQRRALRTESDGLGVQRPLRIKRA
jgi:predicted RNA-binding protein Jag